MASLVPGFQPLNERGMFGRAKPLMQDIQQPLASTGQESAAVHPQAGEHTRTVDAFAIWVDPVRRPKAEPCTSGSSTQNTRYSRTPAR